MLSSSEKSIIKGLSLTVIIFFATMLSIWLPTEIQNYRETDDPKLPLFDWNTTSSLSLANDMESRANELLFVQVKTGIITDAPDNVEVSCEENGKPVDCGDAFSYAGTSYIIMENNVYGFMAYYNQEIENWNMSFDKMNRTSEALYFIEFFQLETLHPALNRDLQTIINYTELTEHENGVEQQKAIDEGDITISIWHWYSDGTVIYIKSFENEVFFYIHHFREFVSDFNRVGGYTDHNYQELYFKANIAHYFDNYMAALTSYLEPFIIG